MGHVRQEGALGGAGLVSLGEGVFQQCFLLHLVARLLVDAAEAQDHIVAVLPVAGAHDGGLAVLYGVAAPNAVVHAHALGVGQLFPQVVGGKRRAQHGGVLLVHALVDIGGQAVGHGQVAGEKLVKMALLLVGHAQGHAGARIQIERADEQVVLGKRLDEVALVALLLHFLEFLVGVVQQKALVHKLAVVFHQFDVAHDVNDVAVAVAHAVLGAHGVAHVLESGNALAQGDGVLGQHRRGNHVEAAVQQLVL